MPTSSEVSTRLTADNSQFRSVMNETERVADRAGKSIFKKLDLRFAMMSVATAIGLNIQSIAENMARYITGVSKELEEVYKRIDALTTSVADKTIASMRKQATEETKYQLLLLERERILRRMAEPAPDPAKPPAWMSLLKLVPGLGGALSVGVRALEIAAETGAAKNLENKELMKGRLTEVVDEIAAVEKKRTAELEKQNAKTKEHVGLKEKVLVVEKSITSEQERQLEIATKIAADIQAQASGGFIGNLVTSGLKGSQLNQASDETLREIVRRNLQLIEKVTASGLLSPAGGESIGTVFTRARAVNENARINDELQTRSGLRRDAAFGGQDLARRNFDRDPLVFEDFFNRFVNSQPFNEQAQLLRDLNRKLDQPLKTIDVSQASPFD